MLKIGAPVLKVTRSGQVHAMTREEYHEQYDPNASWSPKKPCLVCNTFTWSVLRDLQGHLRDHNIDSLGSYFMRYVKPTLEPPSPGPSTPRGTEPEDPGPDMSFLDNLEAWSDFNVILESGQRLKCHRVTLAKWR